MPPHGKAQAALALAMLGLCVATGCDRGRSDYFGTVAPKHGPDEIWTNLGAEPESIDPGKHSDNSGGQVDINVFAGLTQQHPKTLQPMPEIATGWDIYDGGRRYVFHLRPSTWSDGTPLTAHDFEWSWKRLLDPKTASKYSMFLYGVRYARLFAGQALRVRASDGSAIDAKQLEALARSIAPFGGVVDAPELSAVFIDLGETGDADASRAKLKAALSGKQLGGAKLQVDIADSSVVAIHARSDLELEVRLDNPLPYFLDILSFAVLMPIPRHVLERLKAEGLDEDLWTRSEHIVTNGPYLIREWVFRQYMLLEKNPHYWDEANVRTPRIRLAMIESPNTALNLYEAGELDSLGDSVPPNEFMDYLRKYKDFRSSPYLGTYFLWINTKAPPLDDVRVRRALLLAIDREQLVKFVTRGGQIPSADLVPAGVAGYAGLKSPLFDPKRARELLAEAGYGPSKPLPKVAVTYNTNEGHKQIALAVQQMWKRELGIEVELRNQEWKVFLKTLQTHDFQVARMGWIGDYADPFTFLEILVSGNGNNHANYGNPEYDRLLERANATPEREQRLALLMQAEALVMNDAPILPIYTYANIELDKPYLRGSFPNYLRRALYKYAWIDEGYTNGLPERPQPDPVPPLLEADVRVHDGADAGAPP